jgi:hypothetical protein
MIPKSPTGNSATTTESGSSPSSSLRKRNRIYRALLTMSAVVFSLAIAEAALPVFERSQLGDRSIEDKLVEDPELGLKLEPSGRFPNKNYEPRNYTKGSTKAHELKVSHSVVCRCTSICIA